MQCVLVDWIEGNRSAMKTTNTGGVAEIKMTVARLGMSKREFHTNPSKIADDVHVLDAETLATVVRHRVPVNAGSIDMLHQLGAASPGHAVWLRINPGFGHGHSNKTNTGGEHSKHAARTLHARSATTAGRRRAPGRPGSGGPGSACS